jgi:CheY-like chemotaxis protein
LCFPAASATDLRAVVGSGKSDDDRPRRDAVEAVLVVDDQPDVRATAAAHLTSLGYRVLEADGATAALDKLATGIEVDLLFTDIVMPGELNGGELARRARAARPGLKVLYTSGYPGEQLVEGPGLDIGAALVAKPYRKQELAAAVATALAAA